MQDQRTDRTCPKCDTGFSSVQSLGVCPSCRYTFRVDEYGNLLRRPLTRRILSAFGGVAIIVWLFLWLLVAPILIARHFIIHGFTWIDWLVVAVFMLLTVFGGPIRGLDRRLFLATTPTPTK